MRLQWDPAAVDFLPMDRSNFKPPSSVLLGFESLGMVERGLFSVAGRPVRAEVRQRARPCWCFPASRRRTGRRDPCDASYAARATRVHGWGLGANVGPHPHVIDGLERRLTELLERYGAPVSLVGWSLGGIYAREMARAYPDLVRLVITLGSPYRFRPVIGGTRPSCTRPWPAHEPFPGRLVPRRSGRRSPVPATSIYSRLTGSCGGRRASSRSAPAREHRGGRHP